MEALLPESLAQKRSEEMIVTFLEDDILLDNRTQETVHKGEYVHPYSRPDDRPVEADFTDSGLKKLSCKQAIACLKIISAVCMPFSVEHLS